MSTTAGVVIRWSIATLAGVAVVGASGAGFDSSSERLAADLPECPHAWVFDTLPPPSHKVGDPWPVSGLTPTQRGTETSLAGRATNVPEFHDCQRLIGTDNQYKGMAAVFASYQLDSSSRAGRKLPSAQEALAYAEVYSVDAFPALGIRRGFNCLFLYEVEGQRRARMVWVGANEARCSGTFDATTTEGLDHNVYLVPLNDPKLSVADIPPVARWDRDPSSGLQYIGVKCAASWCEIGPAGLTSSTQVPIAANTTPSLAYVRSRQIKGWYDEQPLAVFSNGVLWNSGVTGTVYPNPDLEGYTLGSASPNTTLDGHWRPAARIFIPKELPGYRSKLHLTRATLPSAFLAGPVNANLVEMCHGSRVKCRIPPDQAQKCEKRIIAEGGDPKWWSRITTAANITPKTRYMCIMYRGHEDLPRIPGTVRWRWSPKDEVIWIRCPAGCCEVEEN